MSLIRKRTNFISGTIGGAGLTDVGTTLTSSMLTSLGDVSAPDIYPIILDPTKSAGEPEIVWVTAHTSGGSTATITRGREESTAREHLVGVTCIHGPTKFDWYDMRLDVDPRWYGYKPDGNTASATTNTTALQTATVFAALGVSWNFSPVNYDRPLLVALPAGVGYFNGEIGVYDASGIVGQGAETTKLIDTRAGATVGWTVDTASTTSITVTSGSPTSAHVGLFISGSGIPQYAYITAVSGATVTISEAATATASGVAATVKTIVSMSLHGADASSNRVDGYRLEGFTLDASGGTPNNRTGISFRNAAKGRVTDVNVWNMGVAYKGHNWWDSTVRDCRAEYCGTTDTSALPALFLPASSADATDCNSLAFDHFTAENCYHDVAIYGASRRPNKIEFGQRCKFETSLVRSTRMLIHKASDVTVGSGTDFSIGDFDAGYATPCDAIEVRYSNGTHIGAVEVEQKAGVAAASVRHGLYLSGGNTGVSGGPVRMNNGGGNPAMTGQPIAYATTYGTNDDLDPNLTHLWEEDGASAEGAVTTSPSSRMRGNPGRRLYLAESCT